MAAANAKDDERAKPVWGMAPARKDAPAKGPAPRAKAKAAPRRATAKGRTAAAPGARARQAPATRRPATRAKAKPKAPRGRLGRRLRQRYAVVYDTDGPRVRLGVCWFVIAFGALIVGPFSTAVVYGCAAALAAAQMARQWRKVKQAHPVGLFAAAGAGLITAGACFGAGGAGLGMLGAVGLAFAGSAGEATSRNPRIADIGWTLQCALAPGVVGMSMVLLSRLDQGSAIALLLLVSAYECGDYLIGSGSRNPFEGPGAGIAGIVVITFIVSTLPISALSFGEAWLFGGLVALLAPAGQLVASGLLPRAASSASGLRRLDSLLLAAPLWAWGVGLVL